MREQACGRTLQVGGVCCLVAAAPIHVRLGILPEMATGLNTAAETSAPAERA